MKKVPDNQIAFYQSPDGLVNIEVLFAEENIWLMQKKMAELFKEKELPALLAQW